MLTHKLFISNSLYNMFYITTYILLTAVSVYFIRNANQRTDRAIKLKRNYEAWLRNAEVRLCNQTTSLDAAYARIDFLEDQRSAAAEQSDALVTHDCMFEPTDEILGAIDADNRLDTDITIDDARLDVLSWSPQHAGDSGYTDNNCSCAYGDEDTSDDC